MTCPLPHHAARYVVSGAWSSHPGRHHATNEDRALLANDLRLVALADGVGGHSAGDVASGLAVEALVDAVGRAVVAAGEPLETTAPQLLEAAFQTANARVFEAGRLDPQHAGMVTTLVAVWLAGPWAVVGNVGDSRAYRLRDGALDRLTVDHTLSRAMRLDPGRASPLDHVLTRAIGAEAEVTVDVGVALLAPGDRFLLCSDGVSDVLDDELLAYVLNLDPDARAVTRALVDGARAAGSEDDVTALVMDVHDERSGGAPWIC